MNTKETLNTTNVSKMLKKISPDDFQNLGINHIGYITSQDGIYYIRGADGSFVSRADSYDLAITAIRQNDLEPVTLH